VLLLLLLLVISSREAFGQIQAASPELVDSTGIVVGPILDFNRPGGPVTVSLLIEGHTTILAFRPGTVPVLILTLAETEGVFFASADCTGQGFAANAGPDSFLEPQAIGGLQYTFFAGPTGTPAPLAYNSVLRGGQTCSAESDVLANALPVTAVRDLMPPWIPPFRIVNVQAPNPVPAVSPAGLAILAIVLGTLSIVLLRRRASSERDAG
jgi:hypothetical protein